MAEVKGKASCPECGAADQDVKYDGRKYYIHCAECRTTTTYQSKSAQARVLKKIAVDIPEKRLPSVPASEGDRSVGGGFFSIDIF